MKKGTQIMIGIVLCFTFLVTGIFIGRQTTKSGVVIDTQIANIQETLGTSLTDGRINVNTATSEELQILPNIGETLAQRIIAEREANGPFTSAEDLARVDGIGQKRVKELADYITTGGLS